MLSSAFINRLRASAETPSVISDESESQLEIGSGACFIQREQCAPKDLEATYCRAAKGTEPGASSYMPAMVRPAERSSSRHSNGSKTST